MLTTLALVLLLLRGLRAPLAELLRGTGKLAEGDLSHRIAISGRDEFADLGGSFNSGMAGDLQTHQQALQHAHANLETLVEERTEELRRANELLRQIDETRRELRSTKSARNKNSEAPASGHQVSFPWVPFPTVGVYRRFKPSVNFSGSSISPPVSSARRLSSDRLGFNSRYSFG